MTLIRKSLYIELVNGRDERLSTLTETKDALSSTTASLTAEQAFVANFDKLQSDLEASRIALNKSKTDLTEESKALKAKGEELENAAGKAEETATIAANNAKKQIDILAGLIEEKASAEAIAEQQAIVNAAEAVGDSTMKASKDAQDALKANEAAIAAVDAEIKTTNSAIDQTEKQVADNKERNSNAGEVISNLTEQKQKLEKEVDNAQTTYNEYLAKNQTTINAFEAQQLLRDNNISKENTTIAFNRIPANAEVTKEANVVMQGVIGEELKAETEAEATQRAAYIKAGQELSVNPNFLTAAQARDLAFANIWSTKMVAYQIKKAAEKGELSTEFAAIPNSVVYALQNVGYAVEVTNVADDSNGQVIVTWQTLEAPKEEEKSEK